MHRIAIQGCPTSRLLQAQARNYSHFYEHKRKRTKLFLKVHHFHSIGGCLLVLLPVSPVTRQTNSLCYKRKQACLLLNREFHSGCCLTADERQSEGTSTIAEETKTKSEQQKTSSSIKLKKREKIDFNKTYTERNFITPLRAMKEYSLKPSDIEGLRKVQRRSPYEDNPPIHVYLRRDVELKAVEIWGSQEALQREQKKKMEEEQKYRDSILNVKKVLKSYSRSTRHEEEQRRQEAILRTSGRVVMTAVIINGTNFALKLIAWLYTGSHSMFAEAIHSFADTCNQLLLAYGIKKSLQTPTQDHPYGYHSLRYVASLISGVGIFFFGTGLSLYHGIMGIMHPTVIDSFLWGYVILGGSFISEGGTLMVAFRETQRGAKRMEMSFKDYVLRSQDPSVNVILLEDIAAVISILIAGGCMGLTSYTGLPIYDSVGSLLVGGVLGTVATFIVYTNSSALVGRSIPETRMLQINREMENDVMIRAIHDVKATDMGNNFVRYKAEVDFDGRELTRSYLDSQNLEALLEELTKLKSIEEVEVFMLKHGENIVDLLGGEVDRIETILKKRHPEIRHVDLEVL